MSNSVTKSTNLKAEETALVRSSLQVRICLPVSDVQMKSATELLLYMKNPRRNEK
ncbi:hypothetical protein DSECCO2_598970 [anaerobic digester metagenome]